MVPNTSLAHDTAVKMLVQTNLFLKLVGRLENNRLEYGAYFLLLSHLEPFLEWLYNEVEQSWKMAALTSEK